MQTTMVGRIVVEIHYDGSRRYSGSSYRLVHRQIAEGGRGCRGLLHDCRVSLTPLLDESGRPLIDYTQGWLRGEPGSRTSRVRGGPFYVVVSFAGASLMNTATRIAECMQRGGPGQARIIDYSIRRVSPPSAGLVQVRLETPAHFPFPSRCGGPGVLRYPSPSRLLEVPLSLLLGGSSGLREAARLLDAYVGVTGGELWAVTLKLGQDHPHVWAVHGEVQLQASRDAPERALRLLGAAAFLSEYTGLGSLRCRGLGVARVVYMLS